MGNSMSKTSLQDKIFLHAKRGEYHQLKTLLEQLHRNSVDFQQNRAAFIDGFDAEGNTPLLNACIRGHYQVAELLLQWGANVQIQNNRSDGGSPLHEAITRRHDHIVALLLRFHADPFVENVKAFTPMDFACKTNNVELLRRLECFAPWKGWLELKVPVALGLANEWKRRWVVISYRLPSPFAPPNRRRTHVSLLCYKSTNDTVPDCRAWLDGAKALEIREKPRALQRTNGRTPAQIELKLHRSHSPPTGCSVTGNPRDGYSLQFRPDEPNQRGCTELRVFSETVNSRSRVAQAPMPEVVPAPTAAAAAATSNGPAAAGTAPQPLFAGPMGQAAQQAGADGAPRLSDEQIASQLQAEEDAAAARRLAMQIPPAPQQHSPPIPSWQQQHISPQGSLGTTPPISLPSQDVGALLYPPIQHAQHGGAMPPAGHVSSSAQPMGAAAHAGPSPFANVLNNSPAGGVTGPQAGLPSPGAGAGVQQNADDEGMCCVCLETLASWGFVHDGTVHVNICSDCALLFKQQGKDTCPTCRRKASIVRIFT